MQARRWNIVFRAGAYATLHLHIKFGVREYLFGWRRLGHLSVSFPRVYRRGAGLWRWHATLSVTRLTIDCCCSLETLKQRLPAEQLAQLAA